MGQILDERGYEIRSGAEVSQSLKDLPSVPVAPPHIRSRAALPRRLQYATLAPESEHPWASDLLDVSREYVIDWMAVRREGKGALFTGPSGTGKSWAAAAIVNELLLAYGEQMPLSVNWFSVTEHLGMLLDARHFRQVESYSTAWARLKTCQLLVVDDLLHVSEFPQAKEYLFRIYAERDDAMLPTITTCNAAIQQEDWTAISDVLNVPFVRRLQKNTEGFVVASQKTTTTSEKNAMPICQGEEV